MAIRTFIVAQVRFYRDALAEHLAREDGIEVVGTASERANIVARVYTLRADVGLLDSALQASMTAVRELASSTVVRVIVLGSARTNLAAIAGA